MIKIAKTVVLFLFSAFLSLNAQQTYNFSIETKQKKLPFGLTVKEPVKSPKVSLVLSGGGARSISQIGVIKALVENDIDFDLIIGTSMGAIVGGLYSAGYCLNDLDSLVKVTPWNDFFTFQKNDRRSLFVEQKITEDRAILAVRMDGLNPVIPPSINTGQMVSNFLTTAVINSPVHTDSSFKDLLYDFGAVATNLETGEPVVLNKGLLSLALRASSSVSFLLPPVPVDSVLLVDGGLVANIPTKIAKERNSDFIIAVDCTSPLKSRDELKFPWDIADQIVSIPIQIISRQQKELADVLISPDLGFKKNSDFTELNEVIEKGYSAGKKYAAKIKEAIERITKEKLSESEPITFENISLPENPSLLEKQVYANLIKNKQVTNTDILYELYKIRKRGNVKSISATVIEDTGKSVLKINCTFNPVVKSIKIKNLSNLVGMGDFTKITHSVLDKPFNPKTLLNALIKILRIYRKSGYSLASVKNISFDKNSGSLNVELDEGAISEIRVEGNKKTSPTVILREFPITEGEIFNIGKISEGLENLSNTNLFNNIELYVTEGKDGNVITISVDEKIPTVVRFGIRADNENFFQTSIDIRNENLFGTGTELGFVSSGGLRNRIFILEHLAHRIFNTYFTYRIKGFYIFNDVNVYRTVPSNDEHRFKREKTAEYRQVFYGASFGIGRQVEKFGNLIFEGKYQVDRIKNLFNFPDSESYKINLVSIKAIMSIDSQNKYPFPTEGILLNAYYETAQTALGSDIGFTKAMFDYKSYFSFSPNATVSLAFAIGFADKTLPLTEQFSLGGHYSFFGYRDYEYRGRQILKISVAYRHLMPFKIFFDTYLSFRYDLGSVWAEQEQIRFKDLRHGIGATLSFDTPIGPADFSVGKSFYFKNVLSKNTISSGPFYFYFTIGYYY